jgi:type I restriction enzyme S subunit
MLLSNLNLLATAPGGVARLRELILTLAVQGKLVPQDPKDEPASELLKKIRTEKDRLIAEGKIKRDKPLAEIAEEEKPFDLPAGWEWVRLGDIGYTNIGLTYSPNNVSETGTPVLRSNNVQLGKLDLSDLKRVNMKVKDSVLVAEGDLLICARNGSKALVGKTAMICGLSEPMAFGAFMAIFRSAVNGYVLHFINAPLFRTMISEVNTTTINQITQENLRSTAFPLPPLAEQSRIVARVEELMRLCDALEAKGQLEATQHAQLVSTLLATLTESETPAQLTENWHRIATHFDVLLDRPEAVDALEQTILQLAVRGLLVPQDPQNEPASELIKKIRAEKDKLIAEGKIKRDKPLPPIAEDEQPFALPQGWIWARLGGLANFIDYRGKTPIKTETGVPLITAKNVRQGFINREPREFIAESAYDGWMTRGFPKAGDLLFTTEAPLGNIAAIDIHERFALAQRVICLGIYEREMSGTLCAFMQSRWMQDALAVQASGVTAQGIKSARLQLMPIPVPPLAEQSRIVTRVAQLRRLCADLRQRLTASQSTQAHLAEALVENVA